MSGIAKECATPVVSETVSHTFQRVAQNGESVNVSQRDRAQRDELFRKNEPGLAATESPTSSDYDSKQCPPGGCRCGGDGFSRQIGSRPVGPGFLGFRRRHTSAETLVRQPFQCLRSGICSASSAGTPGRLV